MYDPITNVPATIYFIFLKKISTFDINTDVNTSTIDFYFFKNLYNRSEYLTYSIFILLILFLFFNLLILFLFFCKYLSYTID